MPLSDTACRNAKPKEKRYRLADEKSLYLEVMPTGAKYWRLKYRFDGKEKRLAIGVYPEVGLKEAREKRDDARRLLASGIDPSESRKAEKATQRLNAENSFEAIAREWFAKFSAKWTEGHSSKIIARLERDVYRDRQAPVQAGQAVGPFGCIDRRLHRLTLSQASRRAG